MHAIEFPVELEKIQSRIKQIDPINYAKTRNYSTGAVTYLSPYISRGFISTKQLYQYVLSLNLPWESVEKFVQELAWRDYWQQVWLHKGDDIYKDLKNPQTPINNYGLSKAILNANTGINAVDIAINELYNIGYMHNHMRMYVAAISCNIANSHWLNPAKWLYANLLDGDIASNHLSWQWVAGAFSSKKYVANQNNINKFFNDNQTNTFLDIEYEDFETLETPDFLKENKAFYLETKFPISSDLNVLENKKTLIYNYYNLDPKWHSNLDCQRILLLEPSIFKENPISEKCMNFAINLAKENIKNIIVCVFEFSDLQKKIDPENITFKEHPLNKNYNGNQDDRDWISKVNGYYPSFFAYWKKCKKELLA